MLNRLDELVGSTIRSCILWLNDLIHLKGASVKHFKSRDLHETNAEDSIQSHALGRSSSVPMNATDEALFKILLALSDQQLFTGVAILTLAYIQMDSIVVYHVAIIECMVELAFVVTDSTSTVMVSHLRRPENFFMMTWRGVFILSFMMLLLVTQTPLGHEDWLAPFGMPFMCFWRDLEGYCDVASNPNLTDMITTMLFMAVGIKSTVCNYFPGALSRIFRNALFRYLESGFIKSVMLPRRLSSYSARKRRETDSKVVQVACMVCGAISFFFAVLVFIFAEFTDSVALSLQTNWFLILNSVSWSFYLRSQGASKGREDGEDKWGFGQAVPVFLLGLPFFALAEALYGEPMPCSDGPIVSLVISSMLTSSRCLSFEAITKTRNPRERVQPAGSVASSLCWMCDGRATPSEWCRCSRKLS